jgi:hypothetical protein
MLSVNYAECHKYAIMLSGIMLNVNILSVVAPWKLTETVIENTDIALLRVLSIM